MDYRADGQGGHYRTFAHAFDVRKEKERQQTGNDQQADIESQLDKAEVAVEALGDDVDKIFAGHHGYVRLDFQCDAQRQNDAADQQGYDLSYVGGRVKPEEDEHGEVDEQSEAAGDGYLQRIHLPVGFQLFARHQEGFEDDEQQVEQDGPYAYGIRSEHAQHVGDAGDGRGAQQGFGDEGNAKGIDEQGNNEQQETPGLIYLHNNGCVLLNRRQSSDFFSGCGA